MSRIEELPYEKEKSKAGSDTAQPSAAAIPNSHTEYGPSLPPSMAAPKQTVDELVSDLKKSPFFMTSLDDVGDEYNPGVEAIRALIYEGSRGEQATNFREQGNEDAKARRWTDAREQYSKGLAALKAPRKPEDPANEDEDKKEIGLKELLLVNRALCQLELKNYRSCTLDCMAALGISSSNIKAYYRMASAFFALEKLSEAATACNAGLTVNPTNSSLLVLQAKVTQKQGLIDKKEKKQQEEQDKKRRIAEMLAQALKVRKIRTRNTGQPPEMKDAVIRLLPDPLSLKSTLSFPVMILYPLHLQSDFIKAFGEEQTLQGHLEYLLPSPWDTADQYQPTAVDAYMETMTGGLIRWGKKVELLKVLSAGKVEVVDGLVRVNIVPQARASEWIEAFKNRRIK